MNVSKSSANNKYFGVPGNVDPVNLQTRNLSAPALPASISVWVVILFCIIGYTPLNAQVPFTCEDQFFLTLNTMPPSLNEVIINPQTNNVVFQSINNNLNVNINAAGYRSTDNFIYCVDPGNQYLVRLDANGNGTILASLPLNPFRSYFAGDISPDGKYLILIGTLTYPSGLAVAADMVKVDLEDPNYTITSTAITTDALIFDIAFHPVTNVLYGWDSNAHKLVRIDPNTGVITFPFLPVPAPNITGTLFFDAYGNLFAYGSPTPGDDQNSLYKIDVETGIATFLAQGEAALSSDGCSCPYTVELSKIVEPEITFPCTDVEYTFEIVNTSRRPHQGIRLEDVLPPGFTYVSLKLNEVGGTVLSQPGDTKFILNDIPLPEGKHKITIIVNTGNVGTGIYKNQAILKNLPPALGGKRLSDNPRTIVADDSTALGIIEFNFDTIFVEKALCRGTSSIRLDAAPFAPLSVSYLWSTGAETPFIDISQPADYMVRLYSGCDTAFVVFSVEESAITVALSEEQYTVALGDSISLSASVINTGSMATYEWLDPEPPSIRCTTCPDTWARPFNDITYKVIAVNELGCRDTAEARVKVQKNRNIYFPNVFTPDGQDNNNNYFYAFGDQAARLTIFSVYSRWGENMFTAKDINLNDPNAGWDGTYRGKPVQPGVYVWRAEVVYLDGKNEKYAGDVTVIR